MLSTNNFEGGKPPYADACREFDTVPPHSCISTLRLLARKGSSPIGARFDGNPPGWGQRSNKPGLMVRRGAIAGPGFLSRYATAWNRKSLELIEPDVPFVP